MGLDAADLRLGAEYEAGRGGARGAATERRRLRRLQLGGLLSVVFENRDTLRAAAEEALRADRIDEPSAVSAEAARFAALLPARGGLAASLYLDVDDPSELAGLTPELPAIAAAIRLEVADSATAAEAVPAQVPVPAAYLRFPLTAAQREAWLEGAPVRLLCDHPRCTASVALSDEQRAALAADLRIATA
jgi:hypothetical protein